MCSLVQMDVHEGMIVVPRSEEGVPGLPQRSYEAEDRKLWLDQS